MALHLIGVGIILTLRELNTIGRAHSRLLLLHKIANIGQAIAHLTPVVSMPYMMQLQTDIHCHAKARKWCHDREVMHGKTKNQFGFESTSTLQGLPTQPLRFLCPVWCNYRLKFIATPELGKWCHDKEVMHGKTKNQFGFESTSNPTRIEHTLTDVMKSRS